MGSWARLGIETSLSSRALTEAFLAVRDKAMPGVSAGAD